MRPAFDGKDLRTLRLLHEYGFTDAELADHLGCSPMLVRTMRRRLDLGANAGRGSILHDRRMAQLAIQTHPAQRHFGGRRSHGHAVALKMVDDRFGVEA